MRERIYGNDRVKELNVNRVPLTVRTMLVYYEILVVRVGGPNGED